MAGMVLLAFLPAFAACGRAPSTVPAPAEAPGPASRPDDGLLFDGRLQALVDLQVARDGTAMASSLDDPDPVVRARAAFALGAVQDPEAVPALLERLDDRDPRVRADAAYAVGQSAADPAAASPLFDRLAVEDDATVRAALLEAVAKAGGRGALLRLVSVDPPEAAPDHPDAPHFARALVRFGLRGHAAPAATDWLVAALGAASAAVRAEAAYFFGRTRPGEAWPGRGDEIRAALDAAAPDDAAAMHLVSGLGALGVPGDLPRILGWLREAEDWRARANAARASAGWTGRDDVAAALLAALDDPSTHVARAAAEALAPVLRSAPERLDGVDDWLARSSGRSAVAAPLLDALGYAGRTDELLAWTDGWSDDDPAAGARVLHALTRTPGSRADSILLAAARAGESAAPGSVEALVRRWPLARADSSLHVRYYAAFAAALDAGGPPARTVAPVLGDEAFRRFGSISRLLEGYRRLEPDGDPWIRAALLEGLGRGAADHERIEPLLRRALDDPSPVVREAAAEAWRTVPGAETPPPRDEEAPPAVDWETLAELGTRPRLVLETDEGRITVALDVEEAPLTVQTIARLAGEGRYDGVPFHRVIPNFVAQTGDFVRGDGVGSPGFTIRTEPTRIPFRRGVAGMANAGKDTEGSQFFLTHSPQLHLDGSYTAFGWIVAGADVLDRIDEGERLRSARVQPGGDRAGAPVPSASFRAAANPGGPARR